MIECKDLIDIGVYKASLVREVTQKSVGFTVEYRLVERFKDWRGRGVGSKVSLVSRHLRKVVDDKEFRDKYFKLKREMVESIRDNL